jgi:hypothetical protein
VDAAAEAVAVRRLWELEGVAEVLREARSQRLLRLRRKTAPSKRRQLLQLR